MSACADKGKGQDKQDQSTKKADCRKKIKRAFVAQAFLVVAAVTGAVFIILLSYLQVIYFIFSHIIPFLLTLIALMLAAVFVLQRCKKRWKKKEEQEKQKEEEKQKQKCETEQVKKWKCVPRSNSLWCDIQKAINEKGGNFFLWRRVVERMGIVNAEEGDFLVHLGIVYLTALGKKNDNKKKHFALRKKAVLYQNMKGILQGLYNQKTIIAGIAGYIGTGALSAYIPDFGNLFLIISVVFLIILAISIIIFIFLRGSQYASEIELRKFGETWVRHEATVTNLENVMMQFVMELGEFSCVGVGKSEKKLFMEKIGRVLMDNEEKFQQNMEKIE